jgi:hypothetical protein
MATVGKIENLLKMIRELKYEFVKAQEFQSASIMRDLEKKYLDKKVEDDEGI